MIKIQNMTYPKHWELSKEDVKILSENGVVKDFTNPDGTTDTVWAPINKKEVKLYPLIKSGSCCNGWRGLSFDKKHNEENHS